jgi:hypothetical protein
VGKLLDYNYLDVDMASLRKQMKFPVSINAVSSGNYFVALAHCLALTNSRQLVHLLYDTHPLHPLTLMMSFSIHPRSEEFQLHL